MKVWQGGSCIWCKQAHLLWVKAKMISITTGWVQVFSPSPHPLTWVHRMTVSFLGPHHPQNLRSKSQKQPQRWLYRTHEHILPKSQFISHYICSIFSHFRWVRHIFFTELMLVFGHGTVVGMVTVSNLHSDSKLGIYWIGSMNSKEAGRETFSGSRYFNGLNWSKVRKEFP